MNIKICCIFMYVIICLAESKSVKSKHSKNKHANKITTEPKKRISTQQKHGAGNAKGPMASNVPSSVPLPVVMPFPMIPFDDRYPVIFKPNGKPKKGREKKKDPKGETEDETDKDVDDENDDGGKEYKGVMDVKKGHSNNKEDGSFNVSHLKKVAKQNKNKEDDPNRKVAEGEKNKGAESKERKDVDHEKETRQEKEDAVKNAVEKLNQLKKVLKKNADELMEKEKQSNVEENDDKKDESENNNQKSRKRLRHKSKSSSRGRLGKSRTRRSAQEPVIGNPEDIMPYIILGAEEETVADGNNAHVITTREAGDEYDEVYNLQENAEEEPQVIDMSNDETDYEAARDVYRRDVDEQENAEEEPRVFDTSNDETDYEAARNVYRREVDKEEDAEEEPHVINTRDISEDDDDAREARDIRPRSLPDDQQDLATVEKKYKDTEQAASMLTQIQRALGANPETAVEETHSLRGILQKEMESYDEEITKDLMAAQNAQKRSKIIVNDDGAKDSELQNAKRKLANDRAKEDEVRNELKEIKNVELITTGLELAKYIATENAHHKLEYAKTLNREQVQQVPAPVIQQSSYSPIAYQQPAPYTYAPIAQEAQVSKQPMSMMTPWANEYQHAINYAYSPVHVESDNSRYEMASLGQRKIQNEQPSYPIQHEPQKISAYGQQNQASYFAPSPYQQAVEMPKPATAIHTEAQSRHVTKPTVVKPKPYVKKIPNTKTKFYSQAKPNAQNRASYRRPEQTVASLIGRKPTITFPGPTYSPPPFTTRNGRPKNRYNHNRYNSYNNRYGQPRVNSYGQPHFTAPGANPALLSFFTDQHQNKNIANMYHTPALAANQHVPMYTQNAYTMPITRPDYHMNGYHDIEKESHHYDLHVPFIGHYPVDLHEEASESKTQVPAIHTQIQPTDYISNQQGGQYALPRPSGPSFGAPAPVIYQVPASFSESIASSKGGIPSFYNNYYSVPQMQSAPPQFYQNSQSHPFQTMDTDSGSFHGVPTVASQSPGTHGTAQNKVQNPDKVPLGYGLFPLPVNAENKMDNDKEKHIYESIKDDTNRLHETKQAAEEVTKIENKVGFDPGSIAKLVDFVKEAAEKDVDLSNRAVKRDQTAIKRMEIERGSNNQIDKKSEINNENSGIKEEQQKLKIDTELLKESEERLSKIKRMELIVTGIEAAKYSAMTRRQDKLKKDVDEMNIYKRVKKTVVGRKGFGKRSEVTKVKKEVV